MPLAQVRDALGIPGMDAATARNVRDKSRMKEVLHARRACRARATSSSARPRRRSAFAAAVGFPLVAKPPAGAGAQATYRLDDADALRSWLAAIPPRPEAPGLLEEFLVGDEHTFDSVQIGGRTVWASVSDYRPPPLEVLRNPWIQWTVLLPRELDGPALRRRSATSGRPPCGRSACATALTHMEWFRRPDGSVAVSEVGARPPGAQIASMLGLRARRRLLPAVVRAGDPRPVRPAGAEVRGGLRRTCAGRAAGRVRAVHGVDELQRRIGHLVVEAQLPEPGQPASTSYEGEGYVIVRAPGHRGRRATRLRRSSNGIRVELVEAQMTNVVMLSPGYPAEMAVLHPGAGQAVGARVIGVGDQPPHELPAVARDALAHYEHVSLADEGAVLAALRGLARHARFDQVECLWEPYMILAARIREEFGLPGHDRRRRRSRSATRSR